MTSLPSTSSTSSASSTSFIPSTPSTSSTSDLLPHVDHLSSLYDDPTSAQSRYTSLSHAFYVRFHCSPVFFARAPGRVNLIGEHVDYSGYSVLPMAIERDALLAVHPHHVNANGSDNGTEPNANVSDIVVCNVDASLYHERSYSSWSHFLTIAAEHHWTKYVQCGFKGVFDALALHGHSFTSSAPSRLFVMVDGGVPPSAGLSSSSALVCCSALVAANLAGLDRSVTRKQMASLCSESERFVGTAGGGMDQAISFLSERGVAQRIDFDPLQNTRVSLPRHAVFVVCNSLFESEKAVLAARQFNARVLECKVASLLLAKHFGLRLGQIATCTLKRVQEEAGLSCKQLCRMLRSNDAPLHARPYELDEVEEVLSLSLSDSLAYNPNFSKVMTTQPLLKLRDRALHVYGEAQRVLDFQQECSTVGLGRVEELGHLMDESHASCRDLYECSCEDLDKLISICKQAGATGARLTGAGWGGCAVALFDGSQGPATVDRAVEEIQRRYYVERKNLAQKDPKMNEYIFVSKPSTGAALYMPPVVVSTSRGWLTSLLHWSSILVLGALTGFAIALVSHRRHARLAHSSGLTTAGALTTGAIDAAASVSSQSVLIQ